MLPLQKQDSEDPLLHPRCVVAEIKLTSTLARSLMTMFVVVPSDKLFDDRRCHGYRIKFGLPVDPPTHSLTPARRALRIRLREGGVREREGGRHRALRRHRALLQAPVQGRLFRDQNRDRAAAAAEATTTAATAIASATAAAAH